MRGLRITLSMFFAAASVAVGILLASSGEPEQGTFTLVLAILFLIMVKMQNDEEDR